MAISDDDRDALEAGRLAIQLLAHPAWGFVKANLESAAKSWEALALQKGDTNFEKGAVMAFYLSLNAPQNTIDARDAVLKRLRDLGTDEAEIDADEEKESSP